MTANGTTTNYPPTTPQPEVRDYEGPVTWCTQPGCDWDDDWHHAHGGACQCPDCRADSAWESQATKCKTCGGLYTPGLYQEHKDDWH